MDRRAQPHGRRRVDALRVWAAQLALALAICLVLGIGAIGYVVTNTAEDRLQAAALGECYRVQYLRWEINRKGYTDWVRDRLAGSLLVHGISRAVRTLGWDEQAATSSADFLPMTDCNMAVEKPKTYRPPRPVPFIALRPAYLHCALSEPPRPPSRPQRRCGPARRHF